MSVSNEVNTEVISCDVLVLGGGIAGCLAAIRARECGKDVVLVDKGNLGRSGHSHQMSGSCTYYDPAKNNYDEFYRDCVEGSQWLSDQERLDGMIEECGMRMRELDGWGVNFVKEDGKFVFFAGVGHVSPRNIIMANGGFQLMSVLRGEVLRREVKVVERVMVTDLLTADGELPTGARVVGAVGFNIRNGKFYVFKARATVIATGGVASVVRTMAVPSLSGDGSAMAFRAGCEFRNMDLSFFSYYPTGFNCAPGANILFGEGAYLLTEKGGRFMTRWDPVRMERATRALSTRAIAVEELEGRGPVYLDASHLDEAAHRRIEMAIPIIIKSFELAGFSLKKDKIPYTSSISGYGPGGIRADSMGGTTIPALFVGGAASDHGEDGVSNVIEHGTESAIGGYRAGEAAAGYAAEIEEPALKESQVELLKKRLFAPLKRGSGQDHESVERNCLSILDKGLLGPIRNEEKLKEAITAAQVIREEEIPRLTASDYHNLSRSLGVENALFFMELVPRCALLRKESRGSHYREDYPDKDDANWLKWVTCKNTGSEIEVRAEPIPFKNYRYKPDFRP